MDADDPATGESGAGPKIEEAFVFAVLGIILFRAAFEYWLVQKYIISDDREVDVGVAQFVKWSMFIVPVTCIFLVDIQSIELDELRFAR
ncbi:hypothetical protein Tco_0430842 [Tanacetum coccineum]